MTWFEAAKQAITIARNTSEGAYLLRHSRRRWRVWHGPNLHLEGFAKPDGSLLIFYQSPYGREELLFPTLLDVEQFVQQNAIDTHKFDVLEATK